MQTTTESEVTPSNQREFDARMLRRALELATNGVGHVSPGPLVGCVITDTSGAIVGEGFYIFENVRHAETMALAQAGDKARGGTAYVSLEPHAHHGRTPPCTDALIGAGIRRVVAPIEDLNPKVSGKGFAHLRESGVDVNTGQLAKEAERINEKYLHFMRTGLSFVHLKLAVSLDGKIATRTGSSQWITGPESLARVQELRHEHDAILVGVGTAITDNPLLSDRSGMTRRRSLLRIVMDDRLELPLHSKLVASAKDAPLLVVANDKADSNRKSLLQNAGAEIITAGRNPLSLLQELAGRSVQSVLIEGGARVAGQFVDNGFVNKASFFIAPKIVGGVAAPSAIGGQGVESMADAWSLQDVEINRRGSDVEVTGYFPRQ